MFMTGRAHFHVSHSDAEANLRFALSRLGVDWRHLGAAELEVLLRHLLMAEHRCMPHRSVVPELPTNRWLLPRLRWRRQQVAWRLVRMGGKVSHATLARALPKGTAWPGIAALVGRHAWDPVLDRQPRHPGLAEPPADDASQGLDEPGAMAGDVPDRPLPAGAPGRPQDAQPQGAQPLAMVAPPSVRAANSAWAPLATPSPRAPAAK